MSCTFPSPTSLAARLMYVIASVKTARCITVRALLPGDPLDSDRKAWIKSKQADIGAGPTTSEALYGCKGFSLVFDNFLPTVDQTGLARHEHE